MNDITVWLVILGVIAVAAAVVRHLIAIWITRKIVRAFEGQLETAMRTCQAQLQSIQALPPEQRERVLVALTGQLGVVSRGWQQLNRVSQQRYESRVGELKGVAASVGINWSPGSF